ncbi:UvrABC system protein C [uncultured archaeon]|nr:UvrABC system protein C [uncultured archaeon]
MRNLGKRKSRSLVVDQLENLSKRWFTTHYNLITEAIGDSPGIYALYDGDELYYVGKSIELRKRVKEHLRDRHLASWTRFSLFLVRKEEHIPEIESLIVRIANPKGNRQVPTGRASSSMLKTLVAKLNEEFNQEKEELIGGLKSKGAGRVKMSIGRELQGLVSKKTPLYKTYKNREYQAILTPSGVIRYKNKDYTNPTAAAKAVVGRSSVNGWIFWYIQDPKGDWIRLSEYN